MLGWIVAFTRWDPLQDLLALHERINRLAGTDDAGWMPPVDVYEASDRYVVTAEVAGLARDDVQIQIADGKLTIRGERPSRDAQETASVRFERVERGHGRFIRTFVLPHAVDPAAVTADLDNGVLKISVPKVFDRRRIDVD
jgi:HSP20 family protein